MSFKLTEIYVDDFILCIEKPAGTLSVPDRYNPEKKNLLNYLRNKYTSILPVHRLDKDTSGVMIWALNEEAHKFLNKQFENRSVQKKYLAIVRGAPQEESGLIDEPISYGNQGKGFTNNKGKPSITEWKCLTRFDGFALLEVTPKTGRTHQIRIHLKHLGYPLAVDTLYGNNAQLYAYDIKGARKFNYSKNGNDLPLISRHSLHASELTLLHPSTKKEITFNAEPPKDFRALLNQLKKWRSLV